MYTYTHIQKHALLSWLEVTPLSLWLFSLSPHLHSSPSLLHLSSPLLLSLSNSLCLPFSLQALNHCCPTRLLVYVVFFFQRMNKLSKRTRGCFPLWKTPALSFVGDRNEEVCVCLYVARRVCVYPGSFSAGIWGVRYR